jgi:hypothetical protein
MEAETALTARAPGIDERRARLAAMVENGDITAEQAAWIDFRPPHAGVLEHAKRLSDVRKSRAELLPRASEP